MTNPIMPFKEIPINSSSALILLSIKNQRRRKKKMNSLWMDYKWCTPMDDDTSPRVATFHLLHLTASARCSICIWCQIVYPVSIYHTPFLIDSQCPLSIDKILIVFSTFFNFFLFFVFCLPSVNISRPRPMKCFKSIFIKLIIIQSAMRRPMFRELMAVTWLHYQWPEFHSDVVL